MVVSSFDRPGSLPRGLRRKASARRRRHEQDRRIRLAIDQLESRRALAITGSLSIGGTTVGTYFDAPTGVANLGDFVTVSIEGASGTVIFNGGAGVADGTDIQTIEIVNASPDFQLTFNASVRQSSPVPYSSDGVVHMGAIKTANVIRGINTVRGPVVNVAAPWEIETSAIHLYTFNDGTVTGSTVKDLVGGADGTLFNGASVSGGQLVLAENVGATGASVQYMQMPDGIVPDGTTAATFELWFTASSASGTWGRGFDLGLNDQQYLLFTPVRGGGGSRVAITETSSAGERQVDGGVSYNDNSQHLATVTIDDAANTLTYYIDGVQIGSVTLDGTNLSGLEAVNNFLGRSQFSVDPGFIGSMNQFAIYDRALSPAEILANFAAGPIAGPLTPLGFTQTTAGSSTLLLEGDQTAVFPVNTFVCASPLLPTTGAATYTTVQTVAFDSNTNLTTIVLNAATAAGTTAGALTLAETIRPEFRLTSFVGVNFSNTNLQEWGGLFVDVVEGADTIVNGQAIPNLGILLSRGLLPYSTIGIRRELAATMILGTTAKSSTDGRVFIESATPESLIFVGPRTMPVGTNSRLELLGGNGPFAAGVLVTQNFIGVMNFASAATGQFAFTRGVGSTATLNAGAWPLVQVFGDFAGRINGTGGVVTMGVSRNLTGTARVNAASDVSLTVGGNVQKGAVVTSDQGVTFAVGGNLLGTIQAGSDLMRGAVAGSLDGATLASSNDITLTVGGSIVNSVLAADDKFRLNVARNVKNSRLSSGDSEISFTVGGDVTNARFAGALAGAITGAVSGSSFIAKGDTLDDEDPDVTLTIGRSLASSYIEATSKVSVAVAGNVSKSQFISTTSDVTVTVGGEMRDSTLIAADDGVTLTVARDALNVKVIADDETSRLTFGRNVSGTVQSGSGNLVVSVAGSVLKGSTFTTGGDARIKVTRNFDAAATARTLRFFVGGNVSQASRIVAQAVGDWENEGSANFGIGGRFDGIVNVGLFDAAPGFETVTLVGGGAGSTARFNVDRFETDNLVFNGNFGGNLRVLQDLRANLQFNGNVNRVTLGGRVGSYDVDSVTNAITPLPVAIGVTGRLNFLNSNSYFEAAVPGKNGTFWNDSTKTSTTGLLTTGSYGKVVPTLPLVTPPLPPTPQQYTVPTAPLNFTALPIAPPVTTGGPSVSGASYAAIKVSFDAPASVGGLPVVYYEYTTNALAGTPSWRRFDNLGQGPGQNIQLTCDSAGGAWINGNTYDVSVRAVNALGAGAAPTSVPVQVTLPTV